MLVGHSTGGGEVTRYVGRYGSKRVSKLVLVGAIPPLMLKTDQNPGGLPISVFDGLRQGVTAYRSQFLIDVSIPFYGYNKPGARVSEGVKEAFWRIGIQSSIIATYEFIGAFSETDLLEDLKNIGIPTLILHGNSD